ncbi:hypothetical protein B0J13DRAFT_431286 [Dactylonectria estremocensis]|uniref:RhoGAP-domain-containing protein n=1 Tax=Dactylonectria estremocensis TaxID=1079267 RepID=A0A9P9FJC3_9HYPO|nr:hypothetical protein B0J13DRAFT_431286 [Dactylonectria estremocensis]
MSQLALRSAQVAPTTSASPSSAGAIASGSASTPATANSLAAYASTSVSASTSTSSISPDAVVEAGTHDLHHFHSQQDFPGQDSPTVGRITFSNSPFLSLDSLSPGPSPRSARPPISSPLSTGKSLAYSPTSPSPRSVSFPFRQPPSPSVSAEQTPTTRVVRVQPTETAFYSDSSDSESPEPRIPRHPYPGNPNDSRTVSDPVTFKSSQGSFSTPRPAMAGPVAAAQADSSKAIPRNSSIDSAISAISAKSQGANGPRDAQNGPTDIARLIKTAGSPEAVIQYLLKEKQSQSQQNTQLWRLVDKQRAMILGLNKDLERALQDKEKYRKKLKEVMAIPAISMASSAKGKGPKTPTLPGTSIPRVDIERAKNHIIAPDSPTLDSDSTKNSPIEVTLAPYPITPPADQPNPPPSAVGEILHPAHAMPKPQDHAVDKFDHEEEDRAADRVRKEKADQQLNDIPFNLSLPPSRSLPSEPPRMPPPKPPTGYLPTVAVVEATPQADEGLAQFPAPPPRKPPPAPLLLKQDLPSNAIAAPDDDESDSDYDDLLEVKDILHEKRGRRRTRSEDDREREIIAIREAAARSASKKSKSSQPGSPRDEEFAAVPPLVMQDAGPASLAGMLSVQNPKEITAPLMSPGLPASPRPFNLKAPVNSPPLSPRKAGQFPSGALTPRPPRQPIPLPPNTPLATPASASANAVEGPSSPRAQMPGLGITDNMANRSSPTERTRIFKGLVTEEYPDLLLPPNALPSIEVKVASSRMKPSRASMMSLTQLEEDPVFTLAVISRADKGELWRVEKESASIAKLDQRLKQFTSFTARPPERSLFNGHAPAKLDARRSILETYMDEMLNTPFDTATALEVCKYLSSNVLPPNSDDSVSLGDSGSEISGIKTGPDGRSMRSGYLTKKGKNFGGWKARFFVLGGPHLKYYETPGGAHLGTIKLQNAQIGKQSQSNETHSPTRAASGEELDNQYRHAFLILEPKKKDSNSHVKHVLCAESDRERDRWVQTLLQWIDYRDPDDPEQAARPGTGHDRQASGPNDRPSTAKSRKGGHKSSHHHPSDSDTLVGLRYDTTQAGDAPQLTPARPKTSGGLPDHPHGHGFEGLSTQASKLISGPKDPQVISDSTSWGNRSGLTIPTTEEKKQRKRSFFGFGPKTRSSSDGQDSLFGGSETGSNATPPQNGYHGPVRQAFGVPLAEAVRFCSPVDVNVPLPAVVYRCIQYLDAKDAILEEGIFRLSGSNLVIKQLRERFNTEGDINLVTDPHFHDIHAIAGLLKLYLRELPTTILTRDLHLEFLATTEIADRTDKMAVLNELVLRLPQANATLLKYLIGFLIKIINNSDINKMTVRNVGIVFSPTLNIPAPVFAMFLQNYEDIFGIDPEVYELPSPVSEPDLPSRFVDAPPRFDLPARPSTSGSGSSHNHLRKDPVREVRSTPTPPLMGNPNVARASPPSGSRQGYEPTYVTQLNAGQNPNGYGPQAGYEVHSLHPSARTAPTYDRPHYQSSLDPRLDPRLAAGSGDRSLSISAAAAAAAVQSRTSSPFSQLTGPIGSLLPPSHSDSDGAEPSDAPKAGLGASGHHDADVDADGGDPKRPRACEACRGLKVRCEPDPNDEGPCKRCRKAGRNCVVTVPTRKRQKKTDSRVAELEKKIDALTASLQTRVAGGHAPSGSAPISYRPPPEPPSNNMRHIWKDTGNAHWGPSATTQSPISPTTASVPEHGGQHDQQQAGHPPSSTKAVATGHKRKFDGQAGVDRGPEAASGEPSYSGSYFSTIYQGDIVDRGVINMEKASELFSKYSYDMVVHLPAVVFPPGFTVAELRKTKPTLFLAIMAVAATDAPALQKVLQKELMHVFADKVILTGDKSVEVVQALQVAVIWYWPPEHFEELKFYQLVHIAAVMALDIGLGQRMPQRRGKLLMESWKIHPSRRPTPPDPTSIESRRAWLTCYFLAANTSMALHRPNLIRWTSFMAECVKILETSPDAAPTDAYFCHLVWTHHLAEEVGIQFALDDPGVTVNINDPRTQYALRGMERDLEKYTASVQPDLMQLNLYMHEMALHSGPADHLRPPFSTETLREGLVSTEVLSAAHISALSATLGAIDGLLTTFLGMEIPSVRCLPVFNFVRVAYGLVMLIKLYFSASAPGSELGRVIDKDDMHVAQHLDALLDKFRAAAADERSRPASKFLVVLVMLRSWFHKQCKAEEAKDLALLPPPTQSSTHVPTQQPMRGNSGNEHPRSANTPLQLLSEVATGTSTGGPGPSAGETMGHVFGRWSGVRQPSQPFFHDSSLAGNPNPESVGPGTGPSTGMSMGSSIDTSGADLAAAMAPGIPTLVPGIDPQSRGYTSNLDYSLNAGFDLEGLGLGSGSQGMYESGVHMLLDEPWFSEMFEGIPGSGNVFNF